MEKIDSSQSKTKSLLIPTVFISLLTISYLIQTHLNQKVKERFIDEYFHLKMTEQYLVQKNFIDWDPKITTPPGLYYLGVIYGSVLQMIGPKDIRGSYPEDINCMRYLNSCVLQPINFMLLYWIFQYKFQLQSKTQRNKIEQGEDKLIILHVLIVQLMPLNFTFNFLFYTETLSLTVVLILYYRVICMNEKASNLMNIFIGLFALLVRQTSIIWINYLVLLSVLHQNSEISSLFEYIIHCIKNVHKLIVHYWWVVILDLLFIAFVKYNNGSVVLGHQEHHSFSLHFAQLCYLFLLLIIFPIYSVKEFFANKSRVFLNLRQYFSYKLGLLFVIVIFTLFIQYTSFRHPFLDSDNRHYAQKFYKFVIRHETRKYLFIPVYIISAFITYEYLKQRIFKQTTTLMFIYLLCCSLILVLTPLFELRYFIIPWCMLALECNTKQMKFIQIWEYFYRSNLQKVLIYYIFINGLRPPHLDGRSRGKELLVNRQNGGWKNLTLNLIIFTIINTVVLWIFIERPFINKFMNDELSRFFW